MDWNLLVTIAENVGGAIAIIGVLTLALRAAFWVVDKAKALGE